MGKKKNKTKPATSRFGFNSIETLNSHISTEFINDAIDLFGDIEVTMLVKAEDFCEAETQNKLENINMPKIQVSEVAHMPNAIDLFGDVEVTMLAKAEDFCKVEAQTEPIGDKACEMQEAKATNQKNKPLVVKEKRKVEQLKTGYQNELEDGNFLAEQLQGDYCYDVKQKKWRFYNGRFWEEKRSEKMQRVAAEIFRTRYFMAEKASGVPDALLKKYMADSNLTHVNRALGYAMSNELVEREDFDIRKDLIIVENGALQVSTGCLLPHSKEYWATKMLDITYDKDAFKNSRFESFLSEIFVNDQGETAYDVIEYVQNILGGSILGKPPQLFFIFEGGGSNGKSLLLVSISNVLGDYVYHLPSSELTTKQKYQSGHSAFWAKTAGKRLVVSSELEKGAMLNESYLKNVTGSSPLSLRDVSEKGITFKPEFSLVIDANDLPRLLGKDNGIKRRIVVVPFRRKFEAWEEDPTLFDKLSTPTEQEAILAWLVKGAIRVANDRMIYKQYPYDVRIQTEAFLDMRSTEELLEDPFREYKTECLVDSPGNRVLSSDLHKDFISFCKENGYEIYYNISVEAFGKAITKHLGNSIHTSNGNAYLNIDFVKK